MSRKNLLHFLKRKAVSITGKTKKALRAEIELDGTFFLSSFIVGAAIIGLLLTAVAEQVGMESDTIALSFLQPSVKASFERSLGNMVEGYPIARMIPSIAERDPLTATFLVSIAKKESNWGKYSPKDEDGRECYNYWGYRGAGGNVTPSGYSCFRSKQQAVAVVGTRLDELIQDMQLDTAEKLIVWKCGWSCDGHSDYGVRKWIRDVSYYSAKIREENGLDRS